MKTCSICMSPIPSTRWHRAKTCGVECSKELRRQWRYNQPEEKRKRLAEEARIRERSKYADPIFRAKQLDHKREWYRALPEAEKEIIRAKARARSKANYVPVNQRKNP